MNVSAFKRKTISLAFVTMFLLSTAVLSLGLLEPGHDAAGSLLKPERLESSGVKEAIDNPSLTITNGGNSYWYEQGIVWLVGGSAARSGAIGNSQQSWFETTVSAPFDLNFSWRVSSEQWDDYLNFYIDGDYVDGMSGESGWQTKTIEVAGTGPCTLRWEYSKGSSGTAGSDAGFVDNVQIGACSNSPLNINVFDPSTSDQYYTNVYNWIQWWMTPNIRTSLDVTLYKGMSVVATIASGISSNLYGGGGYYWLVPTSLVTGSDYHVRVANHYNSTDFDNSDDFTINATKTITIVSPTSSTTWQVALGYSIQYQATGLISSVDIELYKGAAWLQTIASDTPTGSSYGWTVSNTLVSGADYRILILEHGNASLSCFSDYFTINATKTIRVNYPLAGYVYRIDSDVQISWQRTGYVTSVDIELYKGASLARSIVNNTAMSSSSGYYFWNTHMDLVTGADYRIRVSEHSNASVFGYSGYFTINGTKTITVLGSPYPVYEKDNVMITWQFTGYIPRVDISLILGGTWHSDIVLNRANSQPTMYPYCMYTWRVPEALTPNSTYQFRVRDSSNSSLYGLSSMFAINDTKVITMVNVMSPVRVYEPAPMMWMALGGIAAVNVDLYNHGSYQFRIWSNLSMPLYPVNQRYWIVPGNISSGNNYTIRVSEFGNPAIYGISNAFTVNATKTMRMLSPTSVTVWNVGHSYTINWETTGAISSVNLDLYRDTVLQETIAFDTPNSGHCSWTVLGSITITDNNYCIRVTDHGNTSLYAESAFFRINATKAIQYVGIPSQVIAGSTMFINWATIGDIPSVDIILYRNGTADTTLASSKANDGYFSWLVPTGFALGTGYSVRVRASGNVSIFAQGGPCQILAFTPAVNAYDVSPGDSITWSVAFNLTMDFPDAFWSTIDDLAMMMGGIMLDSKQIYQDFVNALPDAWILKATIKSIVTTTSYYEIEQIIADVVIKEAGQPIYLPFGVYMQSFLTEMRGSLGILGDLMFPSGAIQVPADIGNNVPIGNWYMTMGSLPFYIPGLASPPSPILPMNYSWLTGYADLVAYVVNGTGFNTTYGTWANYTSTYGFDLNATLQGWDFAWDLLQFNETGPATPSGGFLDMYLDAFTMIGLNLSISSLPAAGSFRYTTGMVFESMNATGSVTGNFTTVSGQKHPYNMTVELSASMLAHDRSNLPPVVSAPADKAYMVGTVGNTITWVATDPTVGITTYVVSRNGTNFASGTWIPGANITVNIDGLALGSYGITITVSDGLGGNSMDSVTLTVIPLVNTNPVVAGPADFSAECLDMNATIIWTVTDPNIGTTNATVLLNGTSWYSFYWTHMYYTNWTSGVPLLPVDGAMVLPGYYNYTLVVTDGLGGRVQDTVFVTVTNTPPSLTHPADVTYMVGDPSNYYVNWTITDPSVFNGNLSVYVNGSFGYNVTWNNGFTFTMNVTGVSVGVYFIMVVAHDRLGGNANDNVTLTVLAYADVNPTASISSSPASVIEGFTVVTFTPTVSGGNLPLSWLWNFGDGSPTITTKGPVVHVYSSYLSSPYNATLRVTDLDGDFVVAWTLVTVVQDVVPTVSIAANDSSPVVGQAVLFTPSVSGGNPPLSWSWNFGDGTPVVTTAGSVTHAYATATSFTARLTITDVDGDVVLSNAVIIAVEVDYIPIVSFTTNVTIIVGGQSVRFMPVVSGGNAPLSWAWDFGDGTPIVTTQATVSHVFATHVGSPFTVRLTVTDADGDAVFDTEPITVMMDLSPDALFTANVTTIFKGQSIRFTHTGSNGNTPSSYSWAFGNGTVFSTSENAAWRFTGVTTYTIRLTVVDVDGDSNTYTYPATITVNDDIQKPVISNRHRCRRPLVCREFQRFLHKAPDGEARWHHLHLRGSNPVIWFAGLLLLPGNGQGR
jgi:PKD repeat protein